MVINRNCGFKSRITSLMQCTGQNWSSPLFCPVPLPIQLQENPVSFLQYSLLFYSNSLPSCTKVPFLQPSSIIPFSAQQHFVDASSILSADSYKQILIPTLRISECFEKKH